MMKISVVVNTYNAEEQLRACLASVRQLADEIVMVDMGSTDKTIKIAKEFKARIFEFPYQGYVEPARNFALSKASYSWILLIDSDEVAPTSLLKRLKQIVKDRSADVVCIPRKNIVFGKWLIHTRWWPDYQVRFFKKGHVSWSDKIHSEPKIKGQVLKLSVKADYALVHHHYKTVEEYLERLNRYTTIQANQREEAFSFKDLIKKPSDEFLSRYFSGKGYADEAHGLTLAILQAFSQAIVEIKVWEQAGFPEEIDFNAVLKQMEKSLNEMQYWLLDQQAKSSQNWLKKLFFRTKKWAKKHFGHV